MLILYFLDKKNVHLVQVEMLMLCRSGIIQLNIPFRQTASVDILSTDKMEATYEGQKEWEGNFFVPESAGFYVRCSSSFLIS